ncbi:MAG: 30S ribosomal protein S16 [Deltaproteobacteria bacterium]|nr:30S ribosomal protein S16 [Deltaproteobacteria bacterium]
MAVAIRLSRLGQRNRPFYRIVATDKENKRDGRFIEMVGTYNALTNPPAVTLKEDLVKKWLERGARPSRLVEDLIKKNFPGLIEQRKENKIKKIQDRRKARKQRAKAAGKSSKKSKKA